ncbi:hypothetical protein CPB83DRAFT_853935 [Crepidotus variabilis]|uniref:F-box domain-containing protein n=1 Tax=Crepidotus variabilis TaxID=179855 RepID=A0A9P6JQC8_9AGAR|nr:hypothetical protein CPB83DRAFT_853935 [Crepidotus variabilis]
MAEIWRELAEALDQNLLEEQAQLRIEINHHHDKLLKHLPPEVAGRVLRFCLPPEPTPDNFTESLPWCESNTKPFHFTLGAICKAWRALLWTYPYMWNVMDLSQSGRPHIILVTS